MTTPKKIVAQNLLEQLELFTNSGAAPVAPRSGHPEQTARHTGATFNADLGGTAQVRTAEHRRPQIKTSISSGK